MVRKSAYFEKVGYFEYRVDANAVVTDAADVGYNLRQHVKFVWLSFINLLAPGYLATARILSWHSCWIHQTLTC